MTAAPELYKPASRVEGRNEGQFDEIQLGIVKWFSPSKGYGFIVPDTPGAQDVFVHHSAIVSEDRLESGDRVRFQWNLGQKGPAAGSVERF